MAKKTDSDGTKKRRWYQNFIDAFTVVKRTYKWIGIALIGLPILIIGLGVLFWMLGGPPILVMLTAVMLALLADTSLLAFLLRPAMYRQVDGKVGAVYAVISQIRKGWVIDEEPVAVNRSQDMVWRLIGRPGVVLISEGPSSRVKPLLSNERRKISRAVSNVPIITIQVGHEEGQTPLPKLSRKLKGLKKVLTKAEVPSVANRLNALGNKGLQAPKGIDPYRAKPISRKALRG